MGSIAKSISKKGKIAVMLVFVLLGIVIALQVKSVANSNKIKNQSISKEVKQSEAKIAELQQQLASNKEKKDALQSRYNTEMSYLYNNEKEFYELYKKYESDIEMHIGFLQGWLQYRGRE